MLKTFAVDKTKDGWTLVADWSLNQPTPSVEETDYVRKFGYYEAEVSRKRFDIRFHPKNLHLYLGQAHAEFLLGHPEKIPEEYHTYRLYFASTVWRDRGGRPHIVCLFFENGEWRMEFCHYPEYDEGDENLGSIETIGLRHKPN